MEEGFVQDRVVCMCGKGLCQTVQFLFTVYPRSGHFRPTWVESGKGWIAVDPAELVRIVLALVPLDKAPRSRTQRAYQAGGSGLFRSPGVDFLFVSN